MGADLAVHFGWYTWQNTTTSPCKFNENHPNAVCIQQNPTECINSSELFVPTIGYYPEQQLVYSNSSLALSDCLTSCWNNCLCIAYGSQFDNGTGRKFWSKGANFIRNPDFNAVYILSQGNSTGTYDFAIIYLQLLVDLTCASSAYFLLQFFYSLVLAILPSGFVIC